jgi:hypothetical protein
MQDSWSDDSVAKETRGLAVLPVLASVLSIINVLLALNFLLVVSLLGWLNFGRAGWATAWIPEAVLLVVLPAAYYIYWHYGPIVAGVALLLSMYSWRQGGERKARVWSLLNGMTIVGYLVVRIILEVQGIRPDIV